MAMRTVAFFVAASIATAQPPQVLPGPVVAAPERPAAVGGELPAETPSPAAIVQSVEQLQANLERVKGLGLNADEERQAAELYQEALQTATLVQQQQASEADFAGRKTESKEELEKQLALPPEQLLGLDSVGSLRTWKVIDLEEEAAGLERQAAMLREKQSYWAGLPATRSSRLTAIPPLWADAQEQKRQLAEQFSSQQGESHNEVALARQAQFGQRWALADATVKRLETEKRYWRSTVDTLPLLQQRTDARLALVNERLQRVQQELNRRRRKEVAVQANEAEQRAEAAEYRPEPIVLLATYNQQITQLRQHLTEQLAAASVEQPSREARLQGLKEEFKAMKQPFQSEQAVGDGRLLAQAMGEVLRERRAKLPSVSLIQKRLQKRRVALAEAKSSQFQCRDRKRQLEPLDAAVQQVMEQVAAWFAKQGYSPTPQVAQAARDEIAKLLKDQQEYLTSLIKDYDDFSERTTKLIVLDGDLMETTLKYRTFIREHDLWIRSAQPLSLSVIPPGWQALQWSFSPENWREVGRDLWQAVITRPLVASFWILGLLWVVVLQRPARQQLQALGVEAASRLCVDYMITLRAVFHTVVVALLWPLVLWTVSVLLDSPQVTSSFSGSLAGSTKVAATVLLLVELLRQLFRANGLADSHFGWPKSCLLQCRRYLRWWSLLLTPLTLWVTGLELQHALPDASAALGRSLFVMLLLIVAYGLWQVLLSQRSAVWKIIFQPMTGWTATAHRMWRPALVVMPVALAMLAVAGYYYTAQRLIWLLLESIALLALLGVIFGLVLRWVLVSRRRLAREQARQRRAQAIAEREQAGSAGSDEMTGLPVEVTDEIVDLDVIGEQTRKLLRMVLFIGGIVGIGLIWQPVVPALQWLYEAPLPLVNGPSAVDPISWGNLLSCLFALGVTIVAVQNLPGLLELVVLQHLPLDAGARYATSTLARYAILAIGLVVVAQWLGITGTNISWLVAAMGVGLGFGLQEIFANFVSGIILLFERPIRVGDIVTLGEKTGIVSRIRIRSTTLTDWDRKEYVVPNKDLVTERLLNWTLSDQTNRITINIGVAYGSPTETACQLLREIAAAHYNVLEDPAPMVVFESFGDSTLNLVMRCYLPNLDNRLATIHDLNTEIDARFKEAGIEIAFPQRDLNIRHLPPGWLGPLDPLLVGREEPTEATASEEQSPNGSG